MHILHWLWPHSARAHGNAAKVSRPNPSSLDFEDVGKVNRRGGTTCVAVEVPTRDAEASPFAGHLGRDKTVNRRFYWPTMFADVRRVVKTCEESASRGRVKAPIMVPLPIFSEPFRRIAHCRTPP